MMTPHLVLQVHGVAYVIVHGHQSHAERTFRLDRIRECWLEEQDRLLASRPSEGGGRG
jgi:predicted DNA-binding transcriptional regulator YafY